MQSSVDRCRLDLSEYVVLTEAASGPDQRDREPSHAATLDTRTSLMLTHAPNVR
jgi:hypothetical protein